MDIFTRVDLRALLTERVGPCVSVFMPTHRGGSEQDPVRFRKLLGQAEGRLAAQGLAGADARQHLAPLGSLLDNPTFWPNQCDGLAAFLARDFLRLYRLPCSFQEEAYVGGVFQIAPLLPLLQGDGRFFVLALSQKSVRLFQGTRHAISPVDLRGVPRSLSEALVTHDRDEVLTYHSRPTSGGTWGAIFEGHGVGVDTAKSDLRLFFQKVDRGLHDVLREEHAPLILAAVDYLAPIYREVNSYPGLMATAIEGNPDRLGDRELHDRAWDVAAPQFQKTLQSALATYNQNAGTDKATTDLRRIVPAAFEGRIETLFVALGKHLWGVLDARTSEVVLHEPPQPGDEDLINVAAIHTLKHGNTVFALPLDAMPGGRALAAIYHLPLPKHGKRP